MSRIGRLPIKVPEGVSVEIDGKRIKVTGPRGSLQKELPGSLSLEQKEGRIQLVSQSQGRFGKSIWGTFRALLANMIEGVATGWRKELELVGTGYRAEVSGETLVLAVGFSHPVRVDAPEGISFKVEKTIIVVEGPDKGLVGQVAADIRKIKPPEPYKGKGIKYKDEVVRRKAGKAAKAVASL